MNRLKFVAVAIFVLLIYLGFWQVRRMEEKNVILTSFEEQFVNAEPHDFVEYNRYELDGKFLYDKTMFLYASNANHEEKHGYFLMTPFCTKEKCVVINRGWVPKSKRHVVDSTQSHLDKRLIVIAIKARRASVFLPANDLVNNIWFYTDLPRMSEFSGTQLEDKFYMILINDEAEHRELSLQNPMDFVVIKNDHLGYAITWFALAAVLLAFVMIMMIRK